MIEKGYCYGSSNSTQAEVGECVHSNRAIDFSTGETARQYSGMQGTWQDVYRIMGIRSYAVDVNEMKVWQMQWIVSMCNDDEWYTLCGEMGKCVNFVLD